MWHGLQTQYIMQKVTVIIPYLENRGWLQEAIDSVPEWCELIVEQGDHNKSVNFNRALKKATGDIIKVLDEDDKLIEGGLKAQIDTLNQGYDFVHANAIVIDKDGNEAGDCIPRITTPTFADIWKFNHICNPTTLYKRDVFERLGGYDESLIKSEDYEYHLRCLHEGMKIGYCNSYVVYCRTHKKQMSKKLFGSNQRIRQNIRSKYIKAFQTRPLTHTEELYKRYKKGS